MTYHYGQFTTEHLLKMREGIILFNEEKFFECHEFLEDLWIEDNTDNARYVYWAVIQYAVAMYHLREDNVKGVQGLLRKAKDKLVECEKRKVETELLYKFLNWEKFKKNIRETPLEGDIEKYRTLYNFKFMDPKNWDVS